MTSLNQRTIGAQRELPAVLPGDVCSPKGGIPSSVVDVRGSEDDVCNPAQTYVSQTLTFVTLRMKIKGQRVMKLVHRVTSAAQKLTFDLWSDL